MEYQDLVDERTKYTGLVENRDNIRKGAKLINEYLDAGCKILFPDELDNSQPTDIDDKIAEMQKERYKIQATKLELNRLNRQSSRFELFYELVRDGFKAYPSLCFLELISRDYSRKTHVLAIADIHAGARFKLVTNEYSYAECSRRFQILFSKMVEYIKANDITDLKIVTLGDDIQGILRLSDLKLNESSVVEATVFVAKTIAAFLNDLSNYCYIDYYHTPTSNHSQTRPLGTKASEIASEDVEYIIGNYIKDMLVNNDRVNVNTNFGEEYIEIPLFEFNTISIHGHQIKSVKDSIKDLSMRHRKFYDYAFVAHYHASSETVVEESENSDVEVLVCPSFIGTDPYSKSIIKGSKPACKVFVFDEVNGHTDTHKIILN